MEIRDTEEGMVESKRRGPFWGNGEGRDGRICYLLY